MDNYGFNESTSQHQWQTLSDPVTVNNENKTNASEMSDSEVSVIRNKSKNKYSVLTLQLVVAICVLLFLFLLKFTGLPLYSSIMTWYNTEISKSVIYDGDFKKFDFSEIFATVDEV